MAPKTWRRFLKPRMAEFIARVKAINPSIKVAYHSDGDVREVIPELIENSAWTSDPVQPACMDRAELKRVYGDRLLFWGSIDEQYTLPFGSPTDVRTEVLERIWTIRPAGGLISSPTHHVQLDTPLENFWAMVDTIRQPGHHAHLRRLHPPRPHSGAVRAPARTESRRVREEKHMIKRLLSGVVLAALAVTVRMPWPSPDKSIDGDVRVAGRRLPDNAAVAGTRRKLALTSRSSTPSGRGPPGAPQRQGSSDRPSRRSLTPSSSIRSSSSSLTGVLGEAADKGIPVATLDTPVDSPAIVTWIGMDQQQRLDRRSREFVAGYIIGAMGGEANIGIMLGRHRV